MKADERACSVRVARAPVVARGMFGPYRIQAGVVAWGLHTPLRVRGMRPLTPDAPPPQGVVVFKW